jgi:hypothetical protein
MHYFCPIKNGKHMKKNLLFGCLLLSFFGSAQLTNPAPARMKNVDKLKDYAEFMQTRSTELNLPGYMEVYDYNNSEYNLNYRYDYTYVLSNRIATEIFSYYNGTSFEPSSRTRYTYGANYEIVNYDYWNYDEEEWQEAYLDSVYFDAQGNQTKNVSYEYNSGSSSWELNWTEIRTYQYSANNEILSTTYSSLDGGMNLVPEYREVWTWTGGNGPSSGIFQEWDSDTEQWVNEARATNLTWFNFSDFLITAATLEFWDGSEWENIFQIEAAYFANGLEQFYIERFWDGTAYVNDYKTEQTIDANNQRTSFDVYNWNTDEWVLVFAQEFLNTYSSSQALLQVDENEFDFDLEGYSPYRRYVYGESHQHCIYQ